MQNIFPYTCIRRPSNANVRCNRWKLIVYQSLDFPWERYVIKDSDVLELSGGQEILFRTSSGFPPIVVHRFNLGVLLVHTSN